MNIVSAICNPGFLLFVAFLIWRKERSLIAKFFWSGFVVKLVAGISVGLIYTFYYTEGDTFTFFQKASQQASAAKGDWVNYFQFLWQNQGGLEPRANFFVKILSVICLLTNNNYWISSLYFSMISFLGAWWLVKRIAMILPAASTRGVISFLFFPSVVFWSSGIVKESLAMAGLFFLASVFIVLWTRNKVSMLEWILIPVACWVLWNLKYYYMAVFLPVVVATLLVRRLITPSTMLREFLIWISIFIVPLIVIILWVPNFHFERFLNVVVSNYYEFVGISATGDFIQYNHLTPSIVSLLLNSPWALFSGLFRPFLFEASTVFQFFISIENMVVFALFFNALRQIRSVGQSPYRLIIVAMAVYIVLLCTFLALSAPNFGTLVRYRVGFYPFFVFLVLQGNPWVEHFFLLVQRSIFSLVRKES